MGTEAATLKVATWNIHRAVGADGRYAPARIVDVLAELDADVVALQEVALQRGRENFLADLERTTGYRVVGGPLYQRLGTDFGNALLSRHPVSRVDHVDLSVGRSEPRGALDVRIDAGAARPLRVVATHLGLRPGERREQVKRLLAAVACGAGEATLLMGDLNEWYLWGRPLRWLHAHFRVRPHAPATFPARRPIFALDRIWASPCCVLRGPGCHASPLARIASDHLPLVAHVSIRSRGADAA